MNRFFGVLCFFFVLFYGNLRAEQWTLEDGDTLEAEILSFQRGTVILQKPDGGKLLYQIEKFIAEDQNRIREAFPGGERPQKVDPDSSEKRANSPPSGSTKTPKASPKETTSPEKSVPRMAPLRNTSIGDRPPEFFFYAQGSPESLTLEAYRGNLVLIHFWSTQSPVSVEHLLTLKALHQQYSSHGLKMISIALEKQRSVMNNFEKQFGVSWPAAIDRSQKIAQSFGVHALPTFVLVDQNGYIVSDNARPNQIEGDVRKYLGLDLSE